jgi:hypothetical protein
MNITWARIRYPFSLLSIRNHYTGFGLYRRQSLEVARSVIYPRVCNSHTIIFDLQAFHPVFSHHQFHSVSLQDPYG